MKKFTIKLNEKIAAWVRVRAAQHNTSVSRFVGDMLRASMLENREYDQAMQRFLAKAPVRLKRRVQRYSPRKDLHDRAGRR